MFKKMKKYVVFGGSSGIGSCVVSTLLNEGSDVLVFDKEKAAISSSKIKYVQIDLENPELSFDKIKK